MDELKPCPFCGGKADFEECYDEYVFWYVFCCSCRAEGAVENTQEEAAAAWNRRYNDK